MRIREVDEAASVVRDAVSPDADIIFGAVIDENMEDEIMLTVIASGFDREHSLPAPKTQASSSPMTNGISFGNIPAVNSTVNPAADAAAPGNEGIPDFLNTAPAALQPQPQVDQTPRQDGGFGFHAVGTLPANGSKRAEDNTLPYTPARQQAALDDTAVLAALSGQNVSRGPASVQPSAVKTESPVSPGLSAAESTQPGARPGHTHIDDTKPARHEKSKAGRILPWFLQDNDSHDND